MSEESPYYPRMKVQAGGGPEHTKATMCRTKDFKYVRRLYEKDELYDLKNDPGETNNLIDREEYGTVVDDFQKAMLTWLQETADVVPFEEDDRFPKEFMMFFLKQMVPEAVYQRIVGTSRFDG